MATFKFRRHFTAVVDVSPQIGGQRGEETDDEDSFFDLVIKPSDFRAINGGYDDEEASNKDFDFIESPRDVFLSKNDFANSNLISPITPLRSTPKFKVFVLGFKKRSKSEKTESNSELKASPVNRFSKSSKIALKCNAAGSVLATENSLRSQMMKESFNTETSYDTVSYAKSVPTYLKLIKPFYTKASKKAKVTVPVTPSPVNSSERKSSSEGNRFKVAARKLVKSRSTSAAVGMPPLPPLRRRDDTLLEQQDGIQGAILYCKRSYSSSSYGAFGEQKRYSI